MSVPEASMHKNDGPVAGQNNIGTPGQTGTTQTVPEPQRMQSTPDLQLDLRIFTSYPRHQRGTSFRADDIRHQAALRVRRAGVVVRAAR